MTIGSHKKSPETVLREALEVARDELKRVNDHYSCVRPDPFGVVIQALADVPFLAPIAEASDNEKRIVGRLVTDLLRGGCKITVNDGEEDVLEQSADADAIFKAMGSTDRDELFVHLPDPDRRHPRWVLLIWGNDVDVISDYSTILEPLMAGANALAEELGT